MFCPIPNWFHNLKAAVKEVMYRKKRRQYLFMKEHRFPKREMLRIIREKDFQALPENMQEAAEEAVETLLHSGDGQLCDIIIDRATMEAIKEAGQKSQR